MRLGLTLSWPNVSNLVWPLNPLTTPLDRNLYRQILDANASLSDERVALRMNIFDACHAATGVLRFVVPGLEDRHDSLRYWAHRTYFA